MGNFLNEESPKEGLNLKSKLIQIPVDEENYKSILNDMVTVFYTHRKGCETERGTEDYCRKILDSCISGFINGKIWKNAPGKNTTDWYEALSLRLRVFRYDIFTKRLIPGRGKTVSEKIKNTSKEKEDSDFINKTSRSFSRNEEKMMEDFQKRFTDDFPASITVVDEAMIKRLSYLTVLSERDIREVELSKGLTKEIQELVESLGVSGKQRSTAIASEKTGTLEQLSTIYRRTLEEHLEIEKNWQLEELKMIRNAVRRGDLPEFLAMYHLKILYGKTFPNGDELSFQNLDKFLKENNIDA